MQLAVVKRCCRESKYLIALTVLLICRRSTIIEHLLARDCAETGLVYFYCDHQEPKKQSFKNFVGTGISQLLNQAPQCLDDLKALKAHKGGEARGKPSVGDCVQLLKAFTLRFKRVFIVVDALDESSEVKALIEGLNELRSSTITKTTAQVLVTSRQEIQIERRMLRHLTQSLCLAENIKHDIQRFVTDQVQARVSMSTLKFRDPNLRSQITTALCNGADGMSACQTFQSQIRRFH